ncbi:MAG: EAL domain-containing protein [Sphingomonadaceae bacterium]
MALPRRHTTRSAANPVEPPPETDARDLAVQLVRDYEDSGEGWFWATDARGKLTYISDGIAEQLGSDAATLTGTSFQTLFACERGEGHGRERTVALLFGSHKKFSDVTVRSIDSPSQSWWSITGRPTFDDEGAFIGFRGHGHDVTAAHMESVDQSRIVSFDPLTGLFNRSHIERQLDLMLAAFRGSKRTCAVMMIDLDRFKQVNDTLGHQAGDELLEQVSERLRRVLVGNVLIGRLGGDEFQAVFPDNPPRDELSHLADKVIAILSQPFSLDEGRCTIGASIGIAIAPSDGDDREDLIRSADLALYAAKGAGRGVHRHYSHQLRAEAQERQRIEEDLRDALARNEIYLAYEPIVDADNRVVSLEARIRWRHSELDEIEPDVFLPIAQKSRLMVPLGEWAMRRACADAARWPDDVRLVLALTADELDSLGFLSTVAQSLGKSGLPAGRLELALPSTVFWTNAGFDARRFDALKALGVRLAVERFGIASASLRLLRDGPFANVRLDETFVQGISLPDSANRAIVRSVVAIVDDLGLEVQAVGIGSLDELEELRALGIDTCQGPIIADRICAEDAQAALASGAWHLEPRGPQHFRAERIRMLRTISLIDEACRYEVRMRNISRSGCLVEGLSGVRAGVQFIVDLGGGQIAMATARRIEEDRVGLEFAEPLVEDERGALATAGRLSAQQIAALDLPQELQPAGGHYRG